MPRKLKRKALKTTKRLSFSKEVIDSDKKLQDVRLEEFS